MSTTTIKYSAWGLALLLALSGCKDELAERSNGTTPSVEGGITLEVTADLGDGEARALQYRVNAGAQTWDPVTGKRIDPAYPVLDLKEGTLITVNTALISNEPPKIVKVKALTWKVEREFPWAPTKLKLQNSGPIPLGADESEYYNPARTWYVAGMIGGTVDETTGKITFSPSQYSAESANMSTEWEVNNITAGVGAGHKPVGQWTDSDGNTQYARHLTEQVQIEAVYAFAPVKLKVNGDHGVAESEPRFKPIGSLLGVRLDFNRGSLSTYGYESGFWIRSSGFSGKTHIFSFEHLDANNLPVGTPVTSGMGDDDDVMYVPFTRRYHNEKGKFLNSNPLNDNINIYGGSYTPTGQEAPDLFYFWVYPKTGVATPSTQIFLAERDVTSSVPSRYSFYNYSLYSARGLNPGDYNSSSTFISMGKEIYSASGASKMPKPGKVHNIQTSIPSGGPWNNDFNTPPVFSIGGPIAGGGDANWGTNYSGGIAPDRASFTLPALPLGYVAQLPGGGASVDGSRGVLRSWPYRSSVTNIGTVEDASSSVWGGGASIHLNRKPENDMLGYFPATSLIPSIAPQTSYFMGFEQQYYHDLPWGSAHWTILDFALVTAYQTFYTVMEGSVHINKWTYEANLSNGNGKPGSYSSNRINGHDIILGGNNQNIPSLDQWWSLFPSGTRLNWHGPQSFGTWTNVAEAAQVRAQAEGIYATSHRYTFGAKYSAGEPTADGGAVIYALRYLPVAAGTQPTLVDASVWANNPPALQSAYQAYTQNNKRCAFRYRRVGSMSVAGNKTDHVEIDIVYLGPMNQDADLALLKSSVNGVSWWDQPEQKIRRLTIHMLIPGYIDNPTQLVGSGGPISSGQGVVSNMGQKALFWSRTLDTNSKAYGIEITRDYIDTKTSYPVHYGGTAYIFGSTN